MKKLAYLLSVVLLFAAAACTPQPEEQEPETKKYLTLDTDTLYVSALGTVDGAEYVEVSCSGTWIIDDVADWVSYEVMGSLLTVEVEANQGKETRTETITLHCEELSAELVVVQFADNKVPASQIVIEDNSLRVVQKEMGSFTIDVVADGEYDVEVDADWLFYNGVAARQSATAESFDYGVSYEKDPRYATITFSSEQTSASVEVMQWGECSLYTEAEGLNFVFAKAAPQRFSYMSNGECTITVIEEWADFEVIEGGLYDTVVVSVLDSDVTEARTATMTLACGEDSAEILLTQEAMKEFGDVTESTFPKDTKIAIKGSSESTRYYSSSAADRSYDGNLDTYWRNNGSNSDKDPWIEYEFDPESYESIDYFIYTPYAPYSSSTGQLGEVEIYVTDKEGNETLYESVDFAMTREPVVYRFQKPITDAVSVRFRVLSAYTTANSGLWYAYIAEMDFYQAQKECDPLTIFSDWSLSELKPEVTLDDIQALTNDAYRNLAERIFYGAYDSEFRVCKFKAYPHPDRDADLFRTKAYTMIDNVTGMYVAEKGDTVKVYVNDTHGLNPMLRIIDWVAAEGISGATSVRSYYTSLGGYVTHSFPLREGYNEFVAQTRGLMYIVCHDDNYTEYPEMTAHFVNSEVNGYIELGKTDMTRAYELLRMGGNTEPHFDMLSHKAIINFPKAIYYESTFLRNPEKYDRVEDLLHIYDTVLYIQEEVQGHYKYKALGKQRVHRNRSLFHTTYTSTYAASTEYRTYYNASNIAKDVCNPTRLWNRAATSFSNDVVGSIWGTAHELGHSNQTDLFKWRGLTEVTNNLMCAITQYKFYGEGNTTMRFNDHFNKGMRDLVTRWVVDPDGTRRRMTHPETVNTPSVGNIEGGVDPTTQLMPFWQLYLYYHVVMGNEDFYPDFYELCRLSPIQTTNDKGHSEALIEFVKLASDAAGEDLSDFCEAWGLPGVNNALKVSHYGTNYLTSTAEDAAAAYAYCKKYDKPKLNPLYINDLNLDLYRNPQAVVAGTHTIDGSGNYTTEGWENVAAWGLKDPVSGEIVAIKLNTPKFTFGIQESVYENDGNGDYLYSNKDKTNRQLKPTTTTYRTDLQLFGIAADGTWVASKSNN